MFDEVSLPRLVLAGTGSGTGKTTLTAGILAAMRARGLKARPFKVGPDFADTAVLAHVAGGACRSLDPWILGREALLQSLHRGVQEADVAVIEGMLGLFDSWGAGTEGSTAELAKLLEAPVVLVLDVSGTVQSAAAVALGFKSVDPEVRIAGVILNRVQSHEQGRWVEEAVWRLAGVPVLGMLPELDCDEDEELDAACRAVEKHVDVDVLMRVAAKARPIRNIPRPEPLPVLESVRLGVAYDEAFNLYYPENLELLTDAGAEIVTFSPLDDARLPRVDALYIAGAPSDGHATRLSENERMRESIRDAALDGLPIYAECGGMAYLGETLRPPASESELLTERLPMVGLLPIDVEVNPRTLTMGYRRLQVLDDSVLSLAGTVLRGHEFHWTQVTHRGAMPPAYQLSDPDGYRTGHEGLARPGLLASNIHLHFGQDPLMAVRLLEAAAHHARAALA